MVRDQRLRRVGQDRLGTKVAHGELLVIYAGTWPRRLELADLDADVVADELEHDHPSARVLSRANSACATPRQVTDPTYRHRHPPIPHYKAKTPPR